MKFIEVDKKLTEDVVKGMKKAEYYLDGKCEFAMLSDNVFVVLEETKVSEGLDAVREEVNGFIDEVLNNHPDFNTYNMDDGYTLVTVYGVYAVENERLVNSNCYGPGADFMKAIVIRNELLEACERGEIFAVAATNDNNDN